MPEDKRPKPPLDFTAEPARQASPRIPLPGPGGGGPGGSPRGSNSPEQAKGTVAGLRGYIIAGLIGGVAAIGASYLGLMHESPGSVSASQDDRRIKELEDRTASLESRIRAISAPAPASAYPSTSGGPEALNEIRSRLDTMVDTSRGLDSAVQSLSHRLQILEQRPATAGESKDSASRVAISADAVSKEAVQAEVATQLAPLTHRLASAERDVEVLTKAQTERLADTRAAALTLALTNLKRAISDGRPFPAELAAVETLSGTKLPISQLSPYKDEGVASLSELQSDFADASKRTIEKHYGNKSNNFMGEVLSRAKSAIRPADSTGDSVEAVLGRMNSALKAGDLRTALTQGAALDDPPQEMKDWLGRAQARVVADEAVRKTDQELLASLTKATSRRQ